MMKWYSFNLATQNATTIVASSENAQFPASNLKNKKNTKVFRSVTASANIVFDMQTTEPVDSVLIKANWKTGRGFTGTLTVEANATDSWGAPAFSTTLSFNDEFNFGKVEFAEQNYRFWRIVGTGSGYLEISNLFIGKAIPFVTNSIDYGWTMERKDNSKSRSNRYRQKFTDVTNEQSVIRASFKFLDKTELDVVLDVFEENQTYNPVWLIIDDTETIVNDKERFAGMFEFDKIPRHRNGSFGLYDLSFAMQEVL